MRPTADFASDVEAQQSLNGLVRERLRDFGIVLKAPKRRVFPVTPMRHPSSSKKVFGKPLRDLALNSVILEGSEVIVPHFLSSIIDYLRKQKDTEGLFRKAGSTARQKSLRAEVESAETFYADNESLPGNIALDAASLLKQWIRELPEPIIPYRVHEAILQSSSSLSDPEKTEAILTCLLLLPPLNASCLALLVRFLLEIADSKEVNKMDSHSLAIVFTPCLFTVDEEASFSKSNQNRNSSLNSKLEVVEILINNAKKVCMIDEAMEMALNIPADFASHSEDNLEEGAEGLAGPSARRRKKKKRRSGSLSRVLSATMKGIRKTISRSATPSGPRTQMVDGSSVMRTPFEFSSPAMAPSAKRRATDRAESPTKKSALDVSMTPQVVRNRSISIKNRFKRKKSPAAPKAKGPLVFTISGPTTPLPNKTTLASLKLLSATTPLSSFSFDNFFPSGGQDLSSGNLEGSQQDKGLNEHLKKNDCEEILNCLSLESKEIVTKADKESSMVNYRTPSLPTCGSSSSASSSRTSISSVGSGHKKHSGDRRRHRSPNERKIGVVRRRSQEMTRRALQGANTGSFELASDVQMKSSLYRNNKVCFNRTRPSPAKGESIEKLITRVQIVPDTIQKEDLSKKFLNESLTNLRQDISSMIESSFGCSSDKSSTVILNDNSFGALLQKTSEPSPLPHPPKENVISSSLASNLTLNDCNLSQQLTQSSVTRSGLMRRQSSAFEFTRPASDIMRSMSNWNAVSYGSIRRQSSAFEIAAKTRCEPIYENFERCATRASLKNRNSSVKDLVKRLETSVANPQEGESKLEHDRRKSVSTSSLPSSTSSFIPPMAVERVTLPSSSSLQTQKVEPTDVFETDQFAEQWVDASEFFGGKSASIFQMNDEAPSGCKRSSIIRMRKEKKGIVSKAVETFTKPALPQNPHTPFKQPLSKAAISTPGSTNPRRTSARMGVATTVRTSNANTPGHVAGKRQTLTGIRTTPQQAIRRTPLTVESSRSSDKKHDPAVNSKSNETDGGMATAPIHRKGDSRSRRFSDKDHHTKTLEVKQTNKKENGTSSSGRKSKRLEGRRHLTIGYEGEVRSPLRERQNNLAATVQRSKSAQTPNPKISVCKRPTSTLNNTATPTKEVLRSHSLRAHPGIVVPKSLKETIYDVTTPRSEKVRRNLSDRIMTPTGGRHEAVPFIKSALSQSRANGTPLRHGASPYLKRSPRKPRGRF